ncbi:hypothetical protein KCP74_09005 [Salmonella enterica subsp. enterica]|nr:hypothetical protein KCP74_09005 [Salmonella enterica subsp. enterica]
MTTIARWRANTTKTGESGSHYTTQLRMACSLSGPEFQADSKRHPALRNSVTHEKS